MFTGKPADIVVRPTIIYERIPDINFIQYLRIRVRHHRDLFIFEIK